MKTSHILTTLAVVAALAVVNVAAAANMEVAPAQSQEQEFIQQNGKIQDITQRIGAKFKQKAIKKHKMRKEVRMALENRDYNAWREAMMPPIFQYINKDNFDTFVDMHEAIQAGDMEKAEELRSQLGLPERHAPNNNHAKPHNRNR